MPRCSGSCCPSCSAGSPKGWTPTAGCWPSAASARRLARRTGYLGLLRDSTAAAERLCHVLANSRLISDLLEVSPESVAWLGSDKDLVPLSYERSGWEITSRCPGTRTGKRHAPDPLIRRREILRIAIADSAGLLDQDQVGAALADTDRAAVLGALRVAETVVAAGGPLKTRVLVVAMGRQGGREIGYGSDADVMYVHRGLPGVRRTRAGAGGPDRQQALQLADPAAQARHPGRARC